MLDGVGICLGNERVPKGVCGRRESSKGALQQAVAPAACGAHFLGTEPLHHVAGVAAVPTAEAEVGGAAHRHVADGTLEGETLAHGTLGAPGLAATVTAVHTKLCRRHRTKIEFGYNLGCL